MTVTLRGLSRTSPALPFDAVKPRVGAVDHVSARAVHQQPGKHSVVQPNGALTRCSKSRRRDVVKAERMRVQGPLSSELPQKLRHASHASRHFACLMQIDPKRCSCLLYSWENARIFSPVAIRASHPEYSKREQHFRSCLRVWSYPAHEAQQFFSPSVSCGTRDDRYSVYRSVTRAHDPKLHDKDGWQKKMCLEGGTTICAGDGC